MEIESIQPSYFGLRNIGDGYLREITETELFDKISIFSKEVNAGAGRHETHTFTVEFYRGPLALQLVSAPVETEFPDEYVDALYRYVCEDVNGLYLTCQGKPDYHHFYIRAEDKYMGFKITQRDNW